MWRPDNWETNPTYPATWMTAEHLALDDKLSRIYELGADAMLGGIMVVITDPKCWLDFWKFLEEAHGK